MAQSVGSFDGSRAIFSPFVDNASALEDTISQPDASAQARTSFLQTPGIVLGFALLVAVLVGKIAGGGRKLPPGSKPLPKLPGLPWAGRFWDVPGPGIEAAWYFGAHHKKYGPIYQWQVMGVNHVWVETDKIARDLLVHRQKNYCERNPTPAAVGVREDAVVLPLAGWTDRFRRSKNFMHAIMRQSHPKAFYDWPALENRRTLRRLVESPERWSEHLIIHCARTIASIAWGDPEHGKKLITVVPELLRAVSPAGPIVNKLPFLMNLPEAVSPFKRAEVRRKQEMDDAFYEALEDVKQRLEKGAAPECWTKLWLESDKSIESCKLDYRESAYAIGSSTFVGIITIGGPLHSFFVALSHYPEWMPKLQEEVDRVCGDRLPTVADLPNLPRIRATAKELLRWRQSTPLGVPHETIDDDVYEGYHIPKGSIVHANHYLISREPTKFPQADQFIPERWLEPSWPTYKEPLTEYPNFRSDTAFGYGPRSCPGVDLTFLELTLLFGALAWGFDIGPPPAPTDASAPAPAPAPWYEVNPYVITMHKPFPVDIRPRSAAKRQAILDDCPDGDAGYMLIPSESERKSRWDIVSESAAGGKLWEWEGLISPHVPPAKPKVYPPGV